MADTDVVELLPCPFCGDSHVSRSIGMAANGADWPYIECEGCGATTEPDVWNRRSPSPAVGELVEVLREVLPFVLDADLESVQTDGGPLMNRMALGRMCEDAIARALSTHSSKEMEQATPSAPHRGCSGSEEGTQ